MIVHYLEERSGEVIHGVGTMATAAPYCNSVLLFSLVCVNCG